MTITWTNIYRNCSINWQQQHRETKKEKDYEGRKWERNAVTDNRRRCLKYRVCCYHINIHMLLCVLFPKQNHVGIFSKGWKLFGSKASFFHKNRTWPPLDLLPTVINTFFTPTAKGRLLRFSYCKLLCMWHSSNNNSKKGRLKNWVYCCRIESRQKKGKKVS